MDDKQRTLNGRSENESALMIGLILVDIQNDFLPGGSLAVPAGDQVIDVANDLLDQYEFNVATQDFHPADHLSFASQHVEHEVGDVIELDGQPQVLWPDHCIQGTLGCEFSEQMHVSKIQHVIQKGTDRQIDSYSGFFDNARRKATGLERLLVEHSVQEVHVLGLATDYCVKFTCLDAADLGFRTRLIERGCRGVDLAAGDCDQALADLRSAGVEIA